MRNHLPDDLDPDTSAMFGCLGISLALGLSLAVWILIGWGVWSWLR